MRLKNIILTELIRDRLVAYEKLEEAMNTRSRDIEDNIVVIKTQLENISKLNSMIDIWQDIINSDINDTLSLEEHSKEKNDG